MIDHLTSKILYSMLQPTSAILQIFLLQIKKKLKGQEYENLTALYEDLDLMFENCKEYNRPESRLFKDGLKLQRAMKHKYDEMAGSDENEDDNSDENSDENTDEDSEDEEVRKFSYMSCALKSTQNRNTVIFILTYFINV